MEQSEIRGLASQNNPALRFAPCGLRLLDLAEQRQRPVEFIIEQPHRIENLADRRGCFRPVSLSKSEDAVVAEISHDSRVQNLMADHVTGLKCRPGRTR